MSLHDRIHAWVQRLTGAARPDAAQDWKQTYEVAADAEAARYERLSLSELLSDIRRGKVGEYERPIWDAVARKGTAAEVGWVLYDVLMSDRPYLERYHCAAALLSVLQCTEFEPVALSANWPTRPDNLARLAQRVEQAAGPHPR